MCIKQTPLDRINVKKEIERKKKQKKNEKIAKME